jgi:hypothetical protein
VSTFRAIDGFLMGNPVTVRNPARTVLSGRRFLKAPSITACLVHLDAASVGHVLALRTLACFLFWLLCA